MPIFDYRCKSCSHEFEALVRGSKVVKCPECESESLDKLLSLPAIKSASTHDKAMRAAKARDKAQGKEREHAQRQYELNHD
ncbi:MAG TPA: zinc ribbon domain-containing protein [Gemmatimonadaceae bacterium]|jgi:putative FmdB family regulatory protein|nr:zinc ribbon domain-containing protein [Gemmatimonadaceae bacterium]